MFNHPSFIQGQFEHRQTYYPKFKVEKAEKITKEISQLKPCQQGNQCMIVIQSQQCCA
ncbi:hypothetical protein GCM10008967_03050 [Bacillus carboniphilus]|uniref:Uncharacterized protein n=1 Tax=Bacillus carboniphilus TaxID=86663 RepID=A0ABN0VS39_9BACI